MAACYNLAGKPSPFDGNVHVPCNLTAVDAGGHLTCCNKGDLCLTNGMCKNPRDSEGNNWYWRIACTDQTWKDPACSRLCEGIEPTRNTGLIFNCLKKDSWCCAYVGEKGFAGWSRKAALNTTCCAIDDLKFSAVDPVVYATATAPVKLTVQPSSATPTTSAFSTISQQTSQVDLPLSEPLPTETDTPVETSPPASTKSKSSSSALPIGLGVGISLGVVLLGVFALLWFRPRRRGVSSPGISELMSSSTALKPTLCQLKPPADLPVELSAGEAGVELHPTGSHAREK
ncbi:hypothetical protein EK21DRAFT_113998 [Setomelanomma holmii]|uniref:Uncharacterized protein n=1 Tax=Setomelanomma holmii TaxID=210430 RepID=A0A9P4LL72_9PLEO|nr:hypothetical protein EK21DRAFT_113998 [Setomelanomma holmii]